jgi:salicylate hydroxylase
MKLHTSSEKNTQIEKSSQLPMEKVAIIGAGIGGLAVAVPRFLTSSKKSIYMT